MPGAEPTWLPGIEILRGIAACTVMFHHLWSLSTLPVFRGYWILEGFGSFGVNLFFVLSAFLLSPPAWKMRSWAELRRFWIRRAGRIYPAYLTNVVILFIFFVPAGVLFTRPGVRQIVTNAVFGQHLRPQTDGSLGANGVLWTLTIEAILYLVLPAIGVAWRRLPFVTFAVLMGAGIGWRVAVARSGDGLRSFYFGDLAVPQGLQSLFVARQFVGYLPLFAIGMAARWLAERPAAPRWRDRLPRPSVPVLVGCLLPAVLLLRFVERASQTAHWTWFVGFDIVMAALVAPVLVIAAGALTRRTRLDSLGEWLGARSYGIYLWHFPLILVAYERGVAMAPPQVDHILWRVSFVVICTLLVATVSYRAVERPAQRRAKAWAR